MSNVIVFVERAPNAPKTILIEAYRFLNHFRYRVRRLVDPLRTDDDLIALDDGVILGTYSLEDARASAEYWGKKVIETGPPEAFGRARQ